MKATKFTIDRSKWACGPARHRTGNTKLLHPADGSMCCLGFYALHCGVTSSEIMNEGEYGSLDAVTIAKLPSELATAEFIVADDSEDTWGLVRNDEGEFGEWDLGQTKLHDQLIDANDGEMPSLEREAEITRLFASIGVDVDFVEEYP